MDNLIASTLSVIVFSAFVIGLAHSIGALPFMIIVGIVVILLLIDFIQSNRQGDKNNNE